MSGLNWPCPRGGRNLRSLSLSCQSGVSKGSCMLKGVDGTVIRVSRRRGLFWEQACVSGKACFTYVIFAGNEERNLQESKGL